MERAIRKTKREILAADKSGDKDRFTEKSIRLRRQREEYEKFSKSAGLLTQDERNQVVGYGRSEASRASWAARSAQTSGNGPKGTPPSGSSAPSSAPSSISKVPLSSGNTSGKYSGKFASAGVDKSSGSGIIKAAAVPKRFKNYVPDESERRKIIEKGIALDRPIFDDGALGRYARFIAPHKDYYDVVCHGAPDHVLFMGVLIDPDTLCAIIAQRKDYIKGKRIRLISCNTGKGVDCVAQYMAKKLHTEVLAPNKIVHVGYPINGVSTLSVKDVKQVDGKSITERGEWIPFFPDAMLPAEAVKDGDKNVNRYN